MHALEVSPLEPAAQALPLAGRPVLVILNAAGDEKKAAVKDRILEVFQAESRPVRVLEIHPQDDFISRCEEKIAGLKAENGIALTVGGDGTVSSAAALCHKHQATLAILPQGTFNYFARQHNIPTDTEAALALLFTGRETTVDAGLLNGQLFLNNACFGLYTRLIKDREQTKSLFGRYRPVAAIAAATSLIRGQRAFAIKLITHKGEEIKRTSMVFVGCNTLQLDNLGMEGAHYTQNGHLAVCMLKKTTPLQRARIVLYGLFKSLDREASLEEFGADRLEIHSRRRQVEVVIDGELSTCATPLRFTMQKQALRLIVPAEISAPA